MKVSELMTKNVQVVYPDQSIKDAAAIMAKIDVGAIPVHDDQRLLGMITDRDIAIRAVAEGLGPDTKIRDAMTEEVMYCFLDQDLEEVSHNMADIQVRRMPVLDRDKRLVGILSLADIATDGNSLQSSEALAGISRPGGQHSQARIEPARGSR